MNKRLAATITIKHILFVCLVVFLFFFLANKIPLWSSDEGRYGEIAREMWESKNFVTPHFNYIQYLEKPVLPPFLTSLSFGIFGVSHLTTRLPGILCALLGILMTYICARRYFNKTIAVFSVMILTTSLGYFIVGRFAIIDMILTFLLSVALFCLMEAYFKRRQSYYLIAYLFMGLGFLAKGLIGIVLPTIVFGAFLIWEKNLKEIKRMHIGWGLLIILTTVVPWLLAILKEAPEFIDVFIIEHHFSRFTSVQQFGRSEPFWFFVPVILVCFLPWALFLPSAIKNALDKTFQCRSQAKYLICWVGMIFLFFSIPSSKLVYYMIPLAMPIAILVAILFEQWMINPEYKPSLLFSSVWKLTSIIFIITFVGVNIYSFFFTKELEVIILRPIVFLSSSVMCLGGILCLYGFSARRKKLIFYSMVGTLYIAFLSCAICMHRLSPIFSTHETAQMLAKIASPTDTVAIFASPDHFSDLPFHLRRRVLIVGNAGTLTRESKAPENHELTKGWFLGIESFIALFNSKTKNIFCLMDDDRLDFLIKKGIKDYTILQQDHKKILITNIVALENNAIAT